MSEHIDWQRQVAAARRNPRTVARDVTVVIPTLGRPIIAGCFAGILQGYSWPAAVIVVNQGPETGIVAMLKDIGRLGIETRYEPCSGRGRALGLNVGLRLVRTQFAVITDDDCVPDERWVEGYAHHFAEHPAMAATGRVVTAGEGRVISVVSDPGRSMQKKPRLTFDRLSGGNCGIAIEILGRVGLFDEDPCMRYAEDGEWAYRALRSGVPIAYLPDLVVAHVGWRDIDERLAQYRRYARSHGAFFGKYIRRGDGFIVLRAGAHLGRALRRWLRGTLTNDPELAANGRSYVLQLMPGIIEGLKSRRPPPSL